MPKSKLDPARALQEVKSAWPSRGYRADFLTAHQHDTDPDPRGELAYQRAFEEAAKKEPPRLPNPSHYPNSQSALALLQAQNKKLFNARPIDGPNPKYESPIPDIYWRPTAEEQKFRSASSTPSVASAQAPAMTPPPSSSAYTASNAAKMALSTTGPGNPPLLMEPKLGAPMGPPSKLR